MSIKYKFNNNNALYFITFAVVGWIDVFTRRDYKDILLDTFSYCVKEKGLLIHGYVIMSNHVHMIIGRKGDKTISSIIRDMKKYSSHKIITAIIEHPQESRKQWMLYLFAKAGKANSNNTHYQFWQQDNHPIELDPHTDIFDKTLNYIHQNPVKAGIVNDELFYLHSSASNYQGYESVFNEVEVLY